MREYVLRRVGSVAVGLSLLLTLLVTREARAYESTDSYGVFFGPQYVFDVDTHSAWGGGIDAVFAGVMYFKFDLQFGDIWWGVDTSGGLVMPVFDSKRLTVPIRAGALFKFIGLSPGKSSHQDDLFHIEGSSSLGLEAGPGIEYAMGKHKDSPRVFLQGDFQVFNVVRYMSSDDYGWLTALNLMAGMRFF